MLKSRRSDKKERVIQQPKFCSQRIFQEFFRVLLKTIRLISFQWAKWATIPGFILSSYRCHRYVSIIMSRLYFFLILSHLGYLLQNFGHNTQFNFETDSDEICHYLITYWVGRRLLVILNRWNATPCKSKLLPQYVATSLTWFDANLICPATLRLRLVL